MARRFHVGLALGACALVVALALLGPWRARAAGPRPPSAAGAAGTPTCTASKLRLDRIGGQGFTSHQEIAFALRNVGSKTCHLKGFPGVGLLDAKAKLLTPTVTRQGGSGHAVVLGPWARAFFNVTYAVAGPCIPHVLNVYGLQVIPPNTTSNLRFYLGKTAMCGPDPHATVTSMSSHPGP